MSPKRWDVLSPCPPEFIAGCGAVHPVLPKLLWHRGVRDPEEVAAFLEPSYEDHVHDPFLFSQMPQAMDRILKAMRNGERMLVFGDYDADGLTGSATVISILRDLAERMRLEFAPEIRSYVPHRDKEGYGLQMPQVERFIQDGVQLVITVDCGIACVPEIAKLRVNGVDVIVLDHHQYGEDLPDGILIHPGIPNETYPFPHLAAVGVAWKFACACISTVRDQGVDIPEGYEKWLLDLVSIATVTDIVPLIGENRALERYGLKVLNKTRRPGLRALIENAGLTYGSISARDIGFMIGPRLNAASRMDHASVGLDLLLSKTDEDARQHAVRIERLNRSRQEAMAGMMKEADELVEGFSDAEHLHVLWRSDWSPALVGLVAGRMSDRFGIPVVAIGKHGGQWIGSGRSYPFYDITDAVKRVGEGLLTRSGGHIQACGFALAEDDHIPEFALRLREDAKRRIGPEWIGPALEVHAELDLRDLDWKLIDVLEQMEPFGCQNPEPMFVTRNVEVISSSTVGKDAKHIRIIGRSEDGKVHPFIAFGFAPRINEVMHGNRIDIVYTVSASEWNGSRDIQCKVKDFRLVQERGSTNVCAEDRLAEAGLI